MSKENYNIFINKENRTTTLVMDKVEVRCEIIRYLDNRLKEESYDFIRELTRKYITKNIVIQAHCSDNDVFDAEKGKRICEKRLAITLGGLRKSIASHYVEELYKEINRAADIWMATDRMQENVREALHRDVE